MMDLFKIWALVTPIMEFVVIKDYFTEGIINQVGIVFVIMGFIGNYQWIQQRKKNNFLKETIDWIEV